MDIRRALEFVADMQTQVSALDRFVHILDRITRTAEHDIEKEASRDDKALSDSERDQLFVLNDRLRKVQTYLSRHGNVLQAEARARITSSPAEFYDFNFEVRLTYNLRKDDSGYDPEDDNIITTRTVHCLSDEDWMDGEFAYQASDGREFQECYLFHDLHDHGYGISERRLTLHEMARIGRIDIDFVVETQGMLDVQNDAWMGVDSNW